MKFIQETVRNIFDLRCMKIHVGGHIIYRQAILLFHRRLTWSQHRRSSSNNNSNKCFKDHHVNDTVRPGLSDHIEAV